MGNQPNRIQWARRRAHSSPSPSRVPSFGCGSAAAAAVSLSNGKPQCELRHLAFCNWDSIARAGARSRAGLPTSTSQRACVWPMLRIPPCFQERPENLLILQFHLQNASRTAWRAGGPNIERSVRLIGCRNALSNVHRPKLLAEMGNLFPGKCALVLCCRGIGRHACPVPRAPRAPYIESGRWCRC